MRADDYDTWLRMGLALRELGEVGRGLWLQWSATSEKFNAREAAKKWDSFQPVGTGYQAVFAEAQRRGWVNPNSNAANASRSRAAENSERELVGRTLAEVKMRSIDWLWTGWIPKGYITIFAGETGAGKSTVLADIAARVSTGRNWPGEIEPRAPGRVLWLGSEDSMEEMTVPRLRACGALTENIIEIQGTRQQGQRGAFSMQDDLDGVRKWLTVARDEQFPFSMLVIDPVTSYLPGQRLRRVDLNDAGQLRTILEPWMRLAQEYAIAIVCVTHFAKDQTRSMLNRVLGTAAFTQTCRSLCAVMDRPAKKDEEQEPGPFEKVLVQVKTNLPDQPRGSWKFETERVEVGVDERNGKPIAATRARWNELDSHITPKSFFGGSRGPVSQTPLVLAGWLRDFFKDAPTESKNASEVKAAAIAAGIVSEHGWNQHSPLLLQKENIGGQWKCKLKVASTYETP